MYGAFTAWLIATYGNRQTPYNFMQYYLFYQTLPQALHSKVESMPRQAIYTLATREGVLDKKQKIIENYQGETKEQLLNLIRENFPLDSVDRRRQDIGEKVTRHLKKLYEETKNKKFTLSKEKKREIFILLDKLRSVIGCQE